MGTIGAAAAFAVLSAVFAAPSLLIGSIALMAFGSAYFLPAKLVVGADGLLYETRLEPRFFGWSDVQQVTPWSRGIYVKLRSGETVAIPTTSRGSMAYEYERVV